jgi:hypothetical protein
MRSRLENEILLRCRKMPENEVHTPSRLHLRRTRTSYFRKETETRGVYCEVADKKPDISIGEPEGLPCCTVVADHHDPSIGGVLGRPRLESYK